MMNEDQMHEENFSDTERKLRPRISELEAEKAALVEALTNARTWFSQIADNTSNPSEPVDESGETVWDAVRDFCGQRARNIDVSLARIDAAHAK